jgi:hypothetical protein
MRITEDDIVSGKIVQMGVPRVRIELIAPLDGLSADEIWSENEVGSLGGRRVSFLGRNAYVRNKRAVARQKDLGDLELLGGLSFMRAGTAPASLTGAGSSGNAPGIGL